MKSRWVARGARAVLCCLYLFLTAGFVFGWPALQQLLIEGGVSDASPLFFDVTFAVASAVVDLAALLAAITNKRSMRLTAIMSSGLQMVGAGVLAVGVGTSGMVPVWACYTLVFLGICIQSCAGMLFFQCTIAEFPGLGTAVFVLAFNCSSALTSYLRLALDALGVEHGQRNFLIFLGCYAGFGALVMLPSSFLWPGRVTSSSANLEDVTSETQGLLVSVNQEHASKSQTTSVWADIANLHSRALIAAVVVVTAVVGLNIKFALGAMSAEVEGALGSDQAVSLATQFSWYAPGPIIVSGLFAHFLIEALRKRTHRMAFILWVLIFASSIASIVVLVMQTIILVRCPNTTSCTEATVQGLFWGSNLLNLFVWNTLYVFVLAQMNELWGESNVPLVFSIAMVLQVVTVACASGLLYWGLISFVQPNAFLIGLTALTLVILLLCIGCTKKKN
jgi:hypothetical protein